jgi:hypothetical protein
MARTIDLLGKKFGQLEVLGIGERRGKKHYWLCKCSCGNEKLIYGDKLRRGLTISCGCYRKRNKIKYGDDFVGLFFSSWYVLEQGKRKGTWHCQCRCGTTKDVFETHLVRGTSKSCGCQIRRGKECSFFTGYEEISGSYWKGILRNAKGERARESRKKLKLNITLEYIWRLFLEQDRKCNLSGLLIEFGINQTASLDRIDNSKGYIEGNVQWIHKDINRMKNVFSQDYFIDTCKKIANHNQG